MAITKKTLKNNTNLRNNVSRMQSMFPNTAALVVDGYVAGLESVAVKDYYNLVILEGDAALKSVPVPDYLILPDDSPYRNSVLFIDSFFNNADVIYTLNYELIKTYKKLKRKLDMFNINYLPSAGGTSSSTPAEVSLTPSGLDKTEPGVHLARILGATSVYYTGSSPNAQTVNLNSIIAYTQEKDPNNPYIPKNLVAVDRRTVLNTSF